MPSLPSLASGFKALREVDLKAVRAQAESRFHIAVIGLPGVGKSTLVNQLLSGPGVFAPFLPRSVSEQSLDDEIFFQPYTVAILVLDAVQTMQPTEHQALQELRDNRVPIIVCHNKADLIQDPYTFSSTALRCSVDEEITLAAIDRESVLQNLVPALLRIYKDSELALARNLPMLREPVSRQLVDETSLINASYSLATGLAQMSLVLTAPLSVADTVVLTKNQAMMAYKIALACGLPADWRQTIPKLAAVIGTAFLWRQIARQLIGLLPVIGIVPKVAVSYAGTYAIGQGIYQWCANGISVNPGALKSVYIRALENGRKVARTIIARRRLAKRNFH